MFRPWPSTGKICYLEIPTADIGRSADFYAQAFGWRIRRRGGRLRDPYGHQWSLSQRIEVLTSEELDRRAEESFSGV